MKFLRPSFFYVLLSLTALIAKPCIAASSAIKQTSILEYENARIPQLPPGMQVMAGYVTLVNKGKQDITIASLSSPTFKRVEIHKTVKKDGMLGMEKQSTLTIKAGSKVELKPRSLHLMLIGPNRPLVLKQEVSIIIVTTNKQKVNLKFIVRSLKQGHQHHKHHHH